MKLKCSKCLELKQAMAFSVDKTKSRGYQYICKDCHNEYTRNVWYIKNREKQKKNSKIWKDSNRSRVLATKYSSNIEQIEKLIADTKTHCPICLRTMNRPHLDHNHGTGVVREFICHRCNTTLGLVDENIEILRSLELYIKKHASVAQ